ncbi:hypothetical protein V2K00_11715 [Pseudomonas alliivorans]|nr:hypothetical protein [Pseudomonas alliivorans]
MNVTVDDSFMRKYSIASAGGLMNDKSEARDNISSTDQVDSPGISSKYWTGSHPIHNHKNGQCDSPGITSNTVLAVANGSTTISGLGHDPSTTATTRHGDSRGITMSLKPPQKNQ